MALRLTQSSLPASEPTDPTEAVNARFQAEHNAVQTLIARGGGALQSRDLSGYVKLFTEAADALENPHRRYQAQKLLIEQGLGSLAGVSDRRATEILLALAHGALIALEQEPAEPQLLDYAGVILYELWSLDAARALFQAAQRLDPELPHLDKNLEAVGQRARTAVPKKLAFHPALAELGKRAKRVAQRAKPAVGMRISLCMIVRDEEDMLPATLEAVKDAVDEMIIVDTGSTDATIEIARSFGATVIEREWTGDFAAARNVSLEAATGDWFLYLDADEVLAKEDVPKLRELASQTWREAFYLHETNYTGTEEAGAALVHSALRLIRNRPEYRFVGSLHEQIALHLPAYVPERIVQSPVRVNHYGYMGVVREAKDKSRRNLEILLEQQRSGLDSAFLHYNLGSEYNALGDAEKAIAEYEIANRILEQTGTYGHEYVPSLAIRTVKAYRAGGRYAEALRHAEKGLERFPEFTDLVYEQGLNSLPAGEVEQAIGYFERAIEMGDGPSRLTSLVGGGTYLPRIALATIHINRKEPEKAVEVLNWSLEHHPEYLGTIFPYATALLQSGTDPDAVADEVQRRAGRLTAAARFMLGTALYEQGHAAQAEPQFRAILERQPHSGAARVALAEALLSQRRYAEAATEAALIDQGTPAALLAVRSELFGLLADADRERAGAALLRAEQVGLPAGERSVFASWLARQRDELAAPPSTSGLSLLATMLEALLRVQDFQNFEQLLPVLEAMPLAVRERRELLAQMYLRRGFLRSAGREWLAVNQEQPDLRSLVGLAHVALRNGQPGPAHEFATRALEIDPDNEVARQLLEIADTPVHA